MILQIPTVYLYAILPLMGVMMIMRVLIVMREDILNQRAQAQALIQSAESKPTG